MTQLMNATIQTFKTENDMELSISRWDGVKDQFMPLFRDAGLVRYSTLKVWNREGQFQLLHVFEYRDQEAAEACIPIWQQIETNLCLGVGIRAPMAASRSRSDRFDLPD